MTEGVSITAAVVRALCITVQADRDPEWAAWQPEEELKWAKGLVRSIANTHMEEKFRKDKP